ncbi:uncharacterized protein LOC106159409 [Lingula anatina]|uniref:Uncharacterized protein LOC106159409 n=1 Tax=Lingula anatina TaxID=7574 RepID=A0A1S3HYP3_LINAN|nr:uncharacterized protein LOC106159409 [Lingula anatina]|eukprot:XP_013391142.1 uncharacterized protein LOC106159409 [Lingula anatina]
MLWYSDGSVLQANISLNAFLTRIATKNVRAGMNWFDLWRHDFKVWWHRQGRKKQDFPLFNKQIMTIEGHFGSGLVSFFVFTRWLCLLNLLLTLFWLSLVVLPSVVHFNYCNITQPFYIRNLLDGEIRP